jgi:uncharacterized membrane protein YtjA (UPF0391 family)
MLHWALMLLTTALAAAVLGFGGITGFTLESAKLVFFAAIGLYVITAVAGVIVDQDGDHEPTAP